MVITSSDAAACGKCTFFDDKEASGALGLCRYNPPISQPSADTHGVWPKVETSDWCGHFQAEMA